MIVVAMFCGDSVEDDDDDHNNDEADDDDDGFAGIMN